MRTVIRPLVPRMEYGLRPWIGRIPYSFVFIFALLLFSTNSSIAQTSVSCYGQINLSINSEIPTKINIGALTPKTNLDHLEAIVENRSSLVFNCSDVGTQIMVTLRDTMSDQRCMVRINVEDKAPIKIMCRDTAIACIEDIPIAEDIIKIVGSCKSLSSLNISHTDIETVPFSGSDTIEYILRQWIVEDDQGNKDSCQSRIYITKFDFSLLIFPDDIELSCDQDSDDTSVTGTLNFTIERLNQCDVAVVCNSLGIVPCLAKTKHIKEWVVLDWNTGEEKRDTQYIFVVDTVDIIAPSSFVMISDSCSTGLVIGSPTFDQDCAGIVDEDVEVYIVGVQIFDIGDTAFLVPDTYELIYRAPPNSCGSIINPDTVTVVVENNYAPVMECDSVKPLAITLKPDGSSIWIKLDSVFESLPVFSCSSVTIVGRKVIQRCMMDTEDFTPTLELCPNELLSGQMPGDIIIEIAAIDQDGNMGNICQVSIDVQEKVPPVIVPKVNPEIPLDMDGMTFTLDTSDILASLTDNSGCIASLTMTGSGIGVTTGSGIPFFNNGIFFTFDCSHAGMYDVAIFATDCDNNMDTAFAKLTVDPDDLCSSPRGIGGQIMVANQTAMPDVSVKLTNGQAETALFTDDHGRFLFDGHYTDGDVMSLSISHDDDWSSGLSVMDLKMIEDYILGQQAFEVWQEASADIDGSGSITAMDLIYIKKLILGIPISQNDGRMPWIFSKRNEEEAFDDRFIYSLDEVRDDELIHIVSAKRGDVNGDVMNLALSRSSNLLNITSVRYGDRNTRYIIDFSDVEDLSALQFSLNIADGHIINVTSPDGMIWYGENYIDILYYKKGTTSSDALIEIEVSHDVNVRPDVSIANRLKRIWYTEEGLPHDLSINVSDTRQDRDSRLSSEILGLYSSPNPTDDFTKLIIQNNEIISGDISVKLYNLQGKTLYAQNWIGADLDKIFPLELPLSGHSGLFIAQVRINDISDHVYIVKN